MSFIGLPEGWQGLDGHLANVPVFSWCLALVGNDFAVTRVSLKPSSSGATIACCQQRSLDAGFQTEDKVCDPRRLAEKASCRRCGFGSLGRGWQSLDSVLLASLADSPSRVQVQRHALFPQCREEPAH